MLFIILWLVCGLIGVTIFIMSCKNHEFLFSIGDAIYCFIVLSGGLFSLIIELLPKKITKIALFNKNKNTVEDFEKWLNIIKKKKGE